MVMLGLSVEEALIDIARRLQGIQDSLTVFQTDLAPHIGHPHHLGVMVYPPQGGYRALPAGQTRIDLKTGNVVRADERTERLSTSLNSLGLAEAHSCSLWSDCNFDVETKWRGVATGYMRTGEGNSPALQYASMDEVVLSVPFPCDVQFIFSGGNHPLLDQKPTTFQLYRYGEITTTDTFAEVKMSPMGGGILALAYRVNIVHIAGQGSKVFIIHNTGLNSADVRLQFRHFRNKGWANSTVTGASLSIPAGDNAIVEDGLYASVFRLHARSTTPGSPSTLEFQLGASSFVR